mgnify:CR=1 FL=1
MEPDSFVLLPPDTTSHSFTGTGIDFKEFMMLTAVLAVVTYRDKTGIEYTVISLITYYGYSILDYLSGIKFLLLLKMTKGTFL